jgi:uncharacterized Zn-binding protein involved in type VI secretion
MVLAFLGVSAGAWAGTFPAFGPQTYQRQPGKPQPVTSTFSVLNPHTTYTLHAVGDEDTHAVILLNGKKIFDEDDFRESARREHEHGDQKEHHNEGHDHDKPEVITVDRAVVLQATNTISVELRGEREDKLTLSIIGVDNDLPVITAKANPGANGAGWNNSNITVTFTCTDATSGVATCPAPVVVSNEGANQVITGQAVDKAGNKSTASITLNIDKSAPSISVAASPGANAAGWNNSNVTVTFTCSDAISGVTVCPAPVVVTAEGANQVISGQAADKAGNKSTANITLNIDKSAPSISAAASPGANAAGWNNSNVTVTFTCNDATSGVTACPAPVLVSAEGANQVISGQATDKAGNTATASVTLNIDKTAPSISAAASPAANVARWNNSDVTVTFTCTDGTSGVATCPAAITTSAEGTNQVVSGQALDKAGNSATTTVTLNIDKTPPTISVVASPAPNAAGWNNSDVTISSNCADSLSGVASCPGPITVSTEGRNQTTTSTATDIAGNTATTATTINLDKTPPTLTILSPTPGAVVNSGAVTVSGSVNDSLSGVASVLCNGTPAAVSGTSFSCAASLVTGANTIKVQATDIAGNSNSATTSVTFVSPVTITAPANLALFNQSPVNVTGTVNDPAAQVSVNGIDAPVSGNTFLATVPLQEGTDTITAVATNSDGTTSTASIQVTLDTTPPHVMIYSPPDLFITTDSNITVTGLVNDIVVGTVNPQQATVTVNGIAADVSNRSFTAANVPLSVGQNFIRATAIDRAGNSATTAIVVVRQAAGIPVVKVFSGNSQTSTIGTVLPQPLIAQFLDAAGRPVANTPVVFRVTAQDGTLGTSTMSGQSSVTTNTDAQGLATAQFTLGTHVGSGNNLVEASATGIPSTALFSASATSTAAALIVPDSGNDQTGATGNTLPLPFIAVVTDSGHNRIPNVPVTFTVTQGNGLIGGQPSFTVNSDADGRAEALLTVGPDEGVNNNAVQANFPGNPGFPVTFTATGRTPGPAAATTISGVVVDNSNQPIPGATMRVFQLNRGASGNLPQPVATPVQTNDQGQFLIQPAPVGAFKLMADGGTATRGGPWPTLEYDIVTVSGRNNTVGSPIYLPQLNPANQICVSETVGGTLTIPEAPGFSLTIAAGSATFPGGSRTGCVSVTPVNMDKVPMSPGFGQQPRFIVTIQPVGTTFNPPAAITLPNVDGLAPRAVTEMYSYDHDLAAFTAIGSATVSDDGSVIKSDPGVGVLKAGWHCGGNPNQPGSGEVVHVKITTPKPVVVAKNNTVTITSTGGPLPGTFKWESSDNNVVVIQGPDNNSSVTVKGIAPGTSTLSVRFTCHSVDRNGVHPFAVDHIDVTTFTITIKKPSGDPLTSGSQDNQFTYVGATGTANIAVEAEINPSSAAANQDIIEKIKWSLASVPNGTTLTWATPFPGDMTAGKGLNNVATLSGYPTSNNDLGLRTIRLQVVDGAIVQSTQTATIALFFERDTMATGRDVPNWFFYWNQTPAGGPTVSFKTIAGIFGRTPALRLWSTYGGPRSAVWVTSLVLGSDIRLDGSGERVTGIDLFANTVAHEKRHVQQVTDSNTVMFFTGVTGVLRDAPAAGWSFNIPFGNQLWNHFIDIDHSNSFTAGDTDLDTNRDDLPDSIEPSADDFVACATPAQPIECQAQRAEKIPENTHKKVDWANPGKQHFH